MGKVDLMSHASLGVDDTFQMQVGGGGFRLSALYSGYSDSEAIN